MKGLIVVMAIFSAASAIAETVKLVHGDDYCIVEIYGARVVSYIANGREILWNAGIKASERAEGWRHGGIALAWPWFGRIGGGDSDIHGFAWKYPFSIKSRTYNSIVLALDTETLRLEYSIILSDKLVVTMQTIGKSMFPQPIAMAFHPYFRVEDRDLMTVEGVLDDPIRCTTAVDDSIKFGKVRPMSKYILRDAKRSHFIEIEAKDSTGVNIWNPGAEKRCPGYIPGDEWRRFIAIEPNTMGFNRFWVLKQGEGLSLQMSIKACEGR